MVDFLEFPAGLRLLSRWQSGDPEAKETLRGLIEETIAGHHDSKFAEPTPTDRVHTTASVHMLGLDILNDLYGTTTAEYYRTDPDRYARVNLMASCLLGITKHYTTWCVYAYSCEAIGQVMMYPDKFPPGSDPDVTLINKDNWQTVTTPDFNTGVPKIISDILRASQDLSGVQPLLQLSAPYSLAADIYGQEPLLSDVLHDPDHVNRLLDHLADQVLAPWIDHFIGEFPNGWVELSDASGSPFFIGPQNCKIMAIRSIQDMVRGKPWAERVFDCNYRGDFVTQAQKKGRASRRQKSQNTSSPSEVDLLHLTDLKYDVCRDFMMRLEADKVPVSFYADQAVARSVPLTTGIGSPQIDSNSIGDLATAKEEIGIAAYDFVAAIKRVCKEIGNPSDELNRQPWPSHVYFEDVNGRSQFELIEIIVDTVRSEGMLFE